MALRLCLSVCVVLGCAVAGVYGSENGFLDASTNDTNVDVVNDGETTTLRRLMDPNMYNQQSYEWNKQITKDLGNQLALKVGTAMVGVHQHLLQMEKQGGSRTLTQIVKDEVDLVYLVDNAVTLMREYDAKLKVAKLPEHVYTLINQMNQYIKSDLEVLQTGKFAVAFVLQFHFKDGHSQLAQLAQLALESSGNFADGGKRDRDYNKGLNRQKFLQVCKSSAQRKDMTKLMTAVAKTDDSSYSNDLLKGKATLFEADVAHITGNLGRASLPEYFHTLGVEFRSLVPENRRKSNLSMRSYFANLMYELLGVVDIKNYSDVCKEYYKQFFRTLTIEYARGVDGK